MKFYDNITSLYEELVGFIKEYESLDDKAPFNNTIFNDIIKIVSSSKDYCLDLEKEFVSKVDKYLVEIDENFKEYKIREKTIKNDFKSKIKEVNKSFDEKIDEIKAIEAKMKDDTLAKNNNNDMDINVYISSSEQNIEIFKQEFMEEKKKYEYQIENAKASYTNSVEMNNNSLESKLEKLEDDYHLSLKDYDKETDHIISRYNKEIERINKQLTKTQNEFNKLSDEHRKVKHNETIDLNDKIRKLFEETNKKILEERKKYTDNQKLYQEEKEKKHNEYTLESQKISKDFVLSMSFIEDEINSLKQEYNKDLIKHKKDLEYKLLELNKALENELKNNISSSVKPNIRKTKKEYYIQSKNETKATKKYIDEITHIYNKNMEVNNYNKKLLDIDRSYMTKKLSEKEIRDNKYYQELSNVDENNLNYNLFLINSEYNKEANTIRLSSNLNSISNDAEFKKIEAENQKNIERLQSKIKRISLEISSADSLRNMIKNLEEEKYIKSKNFYTVSNLLEIEKSKVLDNYNYEQYLLNVKNAELIYNYSKENINLQNKKYEVLKKQENKINNKILDIDLENQKYNEIILNDKRGKEISELTRVNQYELDSISQNILSIRFSIELKYLHQVISYFILLISNLEYELTRIIDLIFERITFRPEYVKIVQGFMKMLAGIGYDYYSSIIDVVNNEQNSIINSRLDFEEQFKFKAYFKEIKDEYDKSMVILEEKADELENELKKILDVIEDSKKQIFTSQSQINYLKENKHNQNKDEAKLTIYNLTEKIKKLNIIVVEETKRIDPIKKEIEFNNNKIKMLNQLKDKQTSNIEQIKYNNASNYYELSKNLKKTFEDILLGLKQKVYTFDEKVDVTNYETIVEQKRKDIMEYDSRMFKKLYSIINEFYNSSSLASEKALNLLKENYERDLNKINNDSIDVQNQHTDKYDKVVSNLNDELRNLKNIYDETTRKFNNVIKNHDEANEKKTLEIINDKNKSKEKFYNEYYALRDNNNALKVDYYNTINRINNDLANGRVKILKDIENENNQIDTDLDQYILAHDTLINSIPEKTKNERIDFFEETKSKNKDIENEKSNVKLEYNEKKKELQKNMSSIDSTLKSNILSLENEKRLLINSEKRKHNNNMRRIK